MCIHIYIYIHAYIYIYIERERSIHNVYQCTCNHLFIVAVFIIPEIDPAPMPPARRIMMYSSLSPATGIEVRDSLPRTLNRSYAVHTCDYVTFIHSALAMPHRSLARYIKMVCSPSLHEEYGLCKPSDTLLKPVKSIC